MKNGILLLGAAAMLAPTGVAAQNGARATFKPISPWAVEYAEHTCRLIRNFSDGKAEITLALERFGLRPTFELGLAGDGLRAFSRPKTIDYRFNNEASARTGQVGRTVLSDGRTSYLIRSVSLDPTMEPKLGEESVNDPKPVDQKAELAVAEGITSISFEKGFASYPVIETGSLRAPVAALHACTDDLLVSLKIDPVRMATISKVAMPVVGLEQWARSISKNYPQEMVQLGAGGIVNMRLIITEEGRVDSCLVGVLEQGPFERAVCKDALQVAFTPALDAAGEPMRSYTETTIIFSMSR